MKRMMPLVALLSIAGCEKNQTDTATPNDDIPVSSPAGPSADGDEELGDEDADESESDEESDEDVDVDSMMDESEEADESDESWDDSDEDPAI